MKKEKFNTNSNLPPIFENSKKKVFPLNTSLPTIYDNDDEDEFSPDSVFRTKRKILPRSVNMYKS